MPTRRTHRKSRHGCKACKHRRVKCDEARPVCSNCSQREELCEYVTEASYIWAEEEAPARRTRRRKTPAQTENHASPSDAPFQLLDRFGGPGASSSSPSLDMTQLRLLVNWQHETCQFYSRDTETRIVWQINLVDEALKTPPLMHGILAVSALHLALSDQSDPALWLEIATAHKGQALHALQKGLRNVTEDNARSMMGLSALVVAYAFGSALTDTGVSDGDRPSLNSLNNVFILCRGVQQITDAAFSFLRQSNFAPLFAPGNPYLAMPDYVKASLDRLDRLNTEYLHAEDHDAATYTRAIEGLRGLSGHAFTQPNSMTLAAGWAIRVPPEYLQYLQANEPLALVVHAHYCAFLHLARGNCFLQYWGRFVLQDIRRLLDESWEGYISWPIAEVFGEGYGEPVSTGSLIGDD
ncbi:Zn(II)2Cys6 transcription factor [Aspergillus undulatus]|uniref:Zn(II)2Cys6 transcription factor n=1 Tax=Aspergillus undulatus TaxID=1810928 RepID=UPI003CCDE345